MDPVSVFGLAASALQLGTFVVESMGTLKKIRDGLKTGNADLRRIQQSISDHQRTLECKIILHELGDIWLTSTDRAKNYMLQDVSPNFRRRGAT
jgi:hypothetical protein